MHFDDDRRSAAKNASQKRRRILALAGAVGVVLLLPRRVSAAYVVRPWPEAKPVPALDLLDLDGKRWQLSSLRGKVVVLNFWATWCGPCLQEMPSLSALATRRRGDGLIVVSVNCHEAPDLVRRFLERLPFKPPVLLDSDGDTTSAWTPNVFPTTVLIGRDGRPVSMVLGDLDWTGADARALLDPLAAVAHPS